MNVLKIVLNTVNEVAELRFATDRLSMLIYSLNTLWYLVRNLDVTQFFYFRYQYGFTDFHLCGTGAFEVGCPSWHHRSPPGIEHGTFSWTDPCPAFCTTTTPKLHVERIYLTTVIYYILQICQLCSGLSEMLKLMWLTKISSVQFAMESTLQSLLRYNHLKRLIITTSVTRKSL